VLSNLTTAAELLLSSGGAGQSLSIEQSVVIDTQGGAAALRYPAPSR
jgi:hypothetical protein